MFNGILGGKLDDMSGNCREMVRPEIGTCVEGLVNQFDWEVSPTDKEMKLSDTNCRALWDFMCKSLSVLYRW